ncbi:MAG: hypothetical protein EHM48_05045, partial [Planctomycetaceae bacterium]
MRRCMPKRNPKSKTSADVIDALKSASLDIDALVSRVDKRLGEDLYWFPVRHHSPAIARHLTDCIRQRKPKVIFIEGPHEAQNMIEFLIDAKTKPPVAIYSSFRNDNAVAASPTGEPATPPRYSVWYPMVSYSPEYVAMLTAGQVGTKTVFIDLPHYALDADVPASDGQAPARPPHRRDLDEIAPASDFYRLLAKAAGHRTWQETWDRLFETPRPADSYETIRRDIAVFCAAVRATTHPESLIADGTLARERFMWRTIRQTLGDMKLSPGDAMVVCGGFHIFLDQNDPSPPPAVPPGTLSVTVAPYSYFRISELSGYGAGNRAPRFYELCFEHHSAGIGQDQVVIDYVIEVIKECRRRGQMLSSADAIGTTQHAMMLARLRGRKDPVLDDIYDALITCCCKGNPKTDATGLLEAIDEVNIGTRLGRVTDRIGRLPIVSDFYEQLARHELEEVAAREKVVTYTLDKRQPKDAARSALLHRLIFL